MPLLLPRPHWDTYKITISVLNAKIFVYDFDILTHIVSSSCIFLDFVPIMGGRPDRFRERGEYAPPKSY